MDVQSLLVLLAELGVGIAGFAAVAVAVASQSSGAHSRLQVAQVNTMMFGSLGVVFYALIPMLIALAVPESPAVWKVPSFLYMLSHIIFLVGLLKRIPAWRRFPGYDIRYTWFAVCALLVSVGLNFYNVVFLGTGWPFVASLACGLAIPSSRFVQIVESLWNVEDEPSANVDGETVE
ncbi:MAG: hypothetical protein AAF098_05190 [Pseudomonadota bacterium]